MSDMKRLVDMVRDHYNPESKVYKKRAHWTWIEENFRKKDIIRAKKTVLAEAEAIKANARNVSRGLAYTGLEPVCVEYDTIKDKQQRIGTALVWDGRRHFWRARGGRGGEWNYQYDDFQNLGEFKKFINELNRNRK